MDGIYADGERADAGAAGTRAASIACRFFGAAGAFVAGGSAEEEGSRGGGAWMLRGAMVPQVLEEDSCARPRRRLLEKKCGCVWSLTIAELIAQRTINKGLLQWEQRGDCRKILIKNPLPSSMFGFRLHANNAERTLCVVGFGVFNGYTLGYTYRRTREVRAGIGQDDVQGGGRMKGQRPMLLTTTTLLRSCRRSDGSVTFERRPK